MLLYIITALQHYSITASHYSITALFFCITLDESLYYHSAVAYSIATILSILLSHNIFTLKFAIYYNICAYYLSTIVVRHTKTDSFG
jgi:hypothetical protein